jgi:GT2 family glycosyltransferase
MTTKLLGDEPPSQRATPRNVAKSIDVADARPAISVAIPTCNGARHIRDALRGILAQESVPFALLVCDDRSDDETVSLIRTEAGDRVQIEINSERLGLAGNWNRCVALCGTPYVAVFHQDDVMMPGHLPAHVAAFGADPRVGIVASATETIDAEGHDVPETIIERGGLGPVDRTFAAGAALPSFATGNPLRCSGVSLRVEAHKQAGGFDQSYCYVVDWDFWIRVARSWSLAWLAKPTAQIRWHADSETHRFKTGTADLEETRRVLDDLFRREGSHWPDAARLWRQGCRRLARAYLNRAHEALRGGHPDLARASLFRSIQLSPAILGRIAADVRRAGQLALLTVAPRIAVRQAASTRK